MELRNNNRQVIRELAQANYRKNKGRNRVLCCAAAMAVFMIFGVFSIARGKMDADYLLYARNSGTVANLALENGSKRQYEAIKTLDYIKHVGIENEMGYWKQGDEVVMTCWVLDETAYEKFRRPAYTDIMGSYPGKANEVMLPLRGLEQLGIKNPQVGMELKADILPAEKQESSESVFVLSGFYKDYVNPYINPPMAFFSKAYMEENGIPIFPAGAVWMEQEGLLANGEDLEIRLYEDVPTETLSQQFIGGNAISYTVVEDLAGSYAIAALCCLVILSGAFLLIYNVLSITLGNDIRQYGLLKTLGTTSVQIRKIVYRQSLRTILTGTLCGGGVGFAVMKWILPHILGGLYLHGLGSAKEMAAFYPGFLVLSIVFVSLVTLLATGVAVRRVIRLSPVESVRYEESGNYKGKRRQKAEEGTSIAGMAWRNITRSKRRFGITLLSLSVGCIAALGAVTISRGTDITNSIEQMPDFDISCQDSIIQDSGNGDFSWNDDTPIIRDEIIEKIWKIDGVSGGNISYTKGCYSMLHMPSKNNMASGDAALLPRLEASRGGAAEGDFFATIQIVDEEYIQKLKEYVKKYDIAADIESLENGTGTVLLHTHELSQKLQEAADKTIGNPIHFYSLAAFGEKAGDDSYLKGELSCAGYLDTSKKHFPPLRMTIHGSGINYFIMSQKAFQNLGFSEKVFGMQIDVERDKEPLIKQTLIQFIQGENGFRQVSGGIYMNCKSDALESASSYIGASRIVMGTLSVLLIVMGISNYFNTLYTSLSGRRKELAVMESVGMTRKQLRRLVILEGAYYGISVTAVLLSAGSVVLWVLGKAIKQNLLYFKFYYPWYWMFGIVLGIMLICILTAVCMYRKMMGRSITERLRRYAD